MSRERLSRKAEAAEIMTAVETLERALLAVDESTLEKQTDSQAKEDKTVVNESVPAGKAELKDQGDQNAKSNDNWPVSEADKMKVAKRLVTLAKELLAE